MDNLPLMKVLYGLNQLKYIIGGFRFIKLSRGSLYQLLVNIQALSIFHDQVYLFFVPKESVHSANVFVSEMTLYFYLSSELVLDLAFDQLLFVEDLQSYDKC